jgi:hypothetical protein
MASYAFFVSLGRPTQSITIEIESRFMKVSEFSHFWVFRRLNPTRFVLGGSNSDDKILNE